MTDMFTKEKRSWIMARIRGRDTQPELLVRRVLHAHGLRFRLHRKDLPGCPDIVLPKYRTAIFVHGCFWHGHTCRDGRRPKSHGSYWNAKLERNVRRDRKNLNELRQTGWNPVVVWECQIGNPDSVLKRIARRLELRH